MSIVELIKLVVSLSNVFTSPLPWQAELAFLFFCVFIIGTPAIIKSFRQPPSPARKAKGTRTRQTGKQVKDA